MAYSNQELQQFVAEYGPSVYRLALAQLRNKEDAEDTYQDVFLRLIRSQPEFQNQTHQRAWFLRVTVNCCKDTLKKASRRDLPLDYQEPQADTPPENLALELALSELSDQQRALIHLHYYEGFKTEEIASILQMNPSTVRSGLKRARKKLKDFMEGEEDFDV